MKNKVKKSKKELKASLPIEITATYQGSKYGTDGVLHAMLRYLILLTAVIGMGVSGCAMLGIEAGFITVIFASVYTYTTLYFLFKSIKGLIGGAIFGFFGMFIALLVHDLSLKKLFIGSLNGIHNCVLDIIRLRGYETVPYLSDEFVTDFGMLIPITAITAITVALSCRRKTRVLPYAILMATSAITFMITGGSVQLRDFAPALAALSAMAVIELSEKGVKDVFRSSFTGFTAFVLAGLLMLTPIVNTNKPMAPITLDGLVGVIDKLTPDAIENNVRRSVYPKRNIFSGKKIMTVYSNSTSTLYLRSWAGAEYQSGEWYAPDYDYGYSYAEFARANDYFELTKKFIETAAQVGYGYDSIGIGLTDVAIVLATKQKNLPLPTMSGRTGAIYDGRELIYPSYIYDGVSTLDSRWKGKILTTAAVIDDYENELLSDVIYGYFEYLVGYCSHGLSPNSSIGRNFVNRLYKYGNDKYINLTAKLTSFGKSAYGELVTDEAVERAVNELSKNPKFRQYFDKVRYSGGAQANGTFEINGTRYEIGNYGRAHAIEVAQIVAEYLADGRKYSLNPKTTGKSVTEELLFGSKEGYCVQFATVGTLIMRKLGFYVRYAEGYVAQDFKKSNGDFAYESKITDRDGHAWCEVWIDGFGWVPLEFTPGFSASNKNPITDPPVTTPPETSGDPIVTTTPPETETTPPITSESIETTTPITDVTTPSDTTVGETPSGGRRSKSPKKPIIVSAAILIPTVLILSYVISTVYKRKKRLDALIEKALSGRHNTEEIRRLSISLSNAISLALGAYKALPKAGEMPEDYGLRLESTLKMSAPDAPISMCVNALVKQVYGFGMDENDIKISALTLSALRKNAIRRVGIFKLIIYKIKGVL